MALDRPTRQLLARMAATRLPPVHRDGPAAARAGLSALMRGNGPGPSIANEHDVAVPGDGADSVPVRLLGPGDLPPAVIVYLHGGGWVVGSVDDYHGFGRTLASATGCAVALVEYRRAPEHPFPAALDDAWAAVRWAASEQAGDLVGEDVPVVVAGDSAGGNLAAVVARRARDHGILLAAQVLVYPITDADLSTSSYLDPSNQLFLDREAMTWFWDQYVPDVADRRQADAAPLQAADLSAVAPAIVVTAGHDVLLDEARAYANRLDDAGVRVVAIHHGDQMHGFFGLTFLPASHRAMRAVARELRTLLTTFARVP